MLTDRELCRLPISEFAIRTSQRRSRTRAVAPRTFEALEVWPSFVEEARVYVDTVDDTDAVNANPLEFLERDLAEPADEVDIRSALSMLFTQVNKVARRKGLIFRYLSGGSGRAFSYTDMVILDRSQIQPTMEKEQLSNRVFGCGEVKGDWQWSLGGLSFEEALNDTKKGKAVIEVLQQLFGDMIMDEAQVGFISNYNETVFFRRLHGKNKTLQYSPVVKIQDAPIEKFLFALYYAEESRARKPNFRRTSVKETPRRGYNLTLPRLDGPMSSRSHSTKRKLQIVNVKAERADKRRKVPTLYEEEAFSSIPAYDMDELGITGLVVGMGKYGNVIAANMYGQKLALKTFDLRFAEATSSFVKEQKAYRQLEELQGNCLPSLLITGRLPHTNVVYLGLTDVGPHDVRRVLCEHGQEAEKEVLNALLRIHEKGVLHGDLKVSHIRWKAGKPIFIDFESSKLEADEEELRAEVQEMELLLLDATVAATVDSQE